MKIYGVYVGNDYDGGGTSSTLFKLKSDAVMEMHSVACKFNEEQGCNYEIIKNDRYDNGWYRDGYDYLHIIEYELI